jgi:hypothetical protein
MNFSENESTLQKTCIYRRLVTSRYKKYHPALGVCFRGISPRLVTGLPPGICRVFWGCSYLYLANVCSCSRTPDRTWPSNYSPKTVICPVNPSTTHSGFRFVKTKNNFISLRNPRLRSYLCAVVFIIHLTYTTIVWNNTSLPIYKADQHIIRSHGK